MEHWLFGLIVSQRQLVHLLAGGTVTAMAAWPSTLLGPEGTDALWSALRDWTGLSPNGLGHALNFQVGARAGVRGGLEPGTARTLRTA